VIPAAGTAPVQDTIVSSGPVEPGNVTVNFKGADIKTVLAYISEVSGVDIVPAPDVKAVVDLKLTNKPWKVALDIILRNYGFAYEREGDIIRVVTVSQLKQEELASQAFNLNYAKCKDTVDALKNIVTEKGKISSDERTNTVVVTDIPTNLYKISQVVAKLDKKTPQVLIEARVVETVLDDTEKMGINWNIKVSAAGAKRPITFPFEAFSVDNKFLPQVQTNASTSVSGSGSLTTATTTESDFPSDASGVTAFPFATTSDFSFGTLDFSSFSAVLEMLKSRANTDTVSNPRIATLNNHEAIINVGQTLNMPKYERNSSTGKMEITGYDGKDLGIILKVTPHINDVGEIVVDLEPQITDLLRYDTLDATSGVVAPVFSTRIAKTQVMIRNGQTIFIGGLIRESDVNSKNKVPVLGDLCENVPILGFLTSKKEIVKQKTELIFFITVNLMTDDSSVANTPKPDKVYSPAYTTIKGPEEAVTNKKGKKNKN
jgi:type IV pilus assembly protein PilQ